MARSGNTGIIGGGGNLSEQILPILAVEPAIKTDPTFEGVAIDRRGFNSADFAILVGEITGSGTKYTYKLQHSDDEAFTTPVDVAAADVSWGSYSVDVTKASDQHSLVRMSCDLRGLKPWIRVYGTRTGADISAEQGVTCVLGAANVAHPAAQAE